MADTAPQPWPIVRLLEQLEEKYTKTGIHAYWAKEQDPNKQRLQALASKLEGRYVTPSVLGVGGSGVVLKLVDDDLSGRPVALKFPRPVPGQEDLLTDLIDREITHLVPLRHAGIVRVHAHGRTLRGGFPFYLMDYIEGSSSAEFLSKQSMDEATFVGLLDTVLDALVYLHSRNTAHLDIKADNVLISENGTPVIADLGTAKLVSSADTRLTTVACTHKYADAELLQKLAKDPSDPNRSKGQVPANEINLEWDLAPLGKMLLNWVGCDVDGSSLSRQLHLTPYVRKYILLMAARLMRGHVDPWLEDRLGLDRRILKELAYTGVAAALQDIRKLSGRYSLVDRIPELNSYHSGTIQVAADAPTTYSNRLKELVRHPLLRRLASISQLGVVSQVYPTATHSRLEHSLGTYHNACRFILSLWYDPLSPLFRQVVSDVDVCAVLVAALLHDVGQFPLAHDLEEIDSRLFDHKRLGQRLLEAASTLDTSDAHSPSGGLDVILQAWGVSSARVLEILNARFNQNRWAIKDRILHSIIDGPLDADKLDYLRRDSDRLRIPYGQGIDVERLLRSLTTVVSGHGQNAVACVGVHEKAKVAAEFMAISRYALFSQAYWQHTVRSMKAMLARAVYHLVVKADRDAIWRGHWLDSFETLTVGLPGVLYRDIGVASVPTKNRLEESTTLDQKSAILERIAHVQSTLSATDAAVLAFIGSSLSQLQEPDAELIEDLFSRTLYKRLFVFSLERSGTDWARITEKWDRLRAEAKLNAYRELEKLLLTRVTEWSSEARLTTAVAGASIDVVRARAAANLPLLLLDVPGNRPGSELPLHYVIEAQRRTLRKDERAVGEAQVSEIWNQFGMQLRERAGKIRVFCHPHAIDGIEAAVPRDLFVRMFEQACS